jgi:hypothetical protein
MSLAYGVPAGQLMIMTCPRGLMRQVRHSATGGEGPRRPQPLQHMPRRQAVGEAAPQLRSRPLGPDAGKGQAATGRDLQQQAWLTGQGMGHCPVGGRSAGSTAGMSGGGAWSNARIQQASSPYPQLAAG